MASLVRAEDTSTHQTVTTSDLGEVAACVDKSVGTIRLARHFGRSSGALLCVFTPAGGGRGHGSVQRCTMKGRGSAGRCMVSHREKLRRQIARNTAYQAANKTKLQTLRQVQQRRERKLHDRDRLLCWKTGMNRAWKWWGSKW